MYLVFTLIAISLFTFALFIFYILIYKKDIINKSIDELNYHRLKNIDYFEIMLDKEINLK